MVSSSVIIRAVLGLLIGICLVPRSADALAAMSVDLGSQFIKIGVVKPGVPMEIALNKESRRKTPNVLSFRNGERLFAEAADALATKYPKSAYQYVLTLLAKQSGDSAVELYKQRFPFAAITFDETRNTVIFPTESEAYNVETLLAMILWSARLDAEAFIGQVVKDVVITVPIFLNQAERRALRAAADISGLNLLQLLTEGSAAALNYGVFRRNEITEKPLTMLIYDMGATKTTATIVEYLLEAEKNKKIKNPGVRTLGVGYDRTLGGLEITTRVANHLKQIFRETVKTPNDITSNPRSMSKLQKEAERVKQILSTNKDTFAQVENLHEERDFRAKMTREDLEKLIPDLEQRFGQPITDALAMAEKKIEEVNHIVLMGAGTRLPKLQETLKTLLGDKEISRFLNTDEAIALGAVYQAARLSNSFKVLPFLVHELVIFPVEVDFESEMKSGEKKDVSRTVFGYKSHYPTPMKIVNFRSYTDDFVLSVNYGDVAYLNDQQLAYLGKRSIFSASIRGVGDVIKKEVISDYTEFKSVKVTLSIDLSGIVDISKAEIFLDRKPSTEELAKYEADIKVYNAYLESVIQQKEEAKKTYDEENNADKKDLKFAQKVDKPREPKTVTIKIPLTVNVTMKDLVDLTEECKESAKNILATFEKVEMTKLEREGAMNALESLLYDLPIKLEDGEEFVQFVTEEEKNLILSEVQRLRLWLEDDVVLETPTEEFKENERILNQLTAAARKRRDARIDMPKAIAYLERAFNRSRIKYEAAKSLTETLTELKVLDATIKTTENWFAEKYDEYEKQPKNEEPVITAADLKEKASELERKVQFLLNNMKNLETGKTSEIYSEVEEEISKTEGDESTAEETSTDQADPTAETDDKVHDASEL